MEVAGRSQRKKPKEEKDLERKEGLKGQAWFEPRKKKLEAHRERRSSGGVAKMTQGLRLRQCERRGT